MESITDQSQPGGGCRACPPEGPTWETRMSRQVLALLGCPRASRSLKLVMLPAQPLGQVQEVQDTPAHEADASQPGPAPAPGCFASASAPHL